MKGLMVEIYKPARYGSNPINKLDGKDYAVIVNLPDNCGVTEPDEHCPAVKIVNRRLYGADYSHAEPIEPGNYAFGGNFIYSSDSRFRGSFQYPIPLHDRRMDMEVR